jgi:3-methyl-2-oxobutanoate hydroxymethyltransferase
MKEAGAHCVKLEGGAEMAPVIQKCTQGGIPVMAHIGFTPQSEHTLGGYRVQGRGDASDRVIADARAVQEAGAFAVVMEMVPGDVAEQISKELTIPTIGIGAGAGCDGQVLVWQDAFGLRTGRMARFVKQYADVHGVLLEAAKAYADDVRGGTFPGADHTF